LTDDAKFELTPDNVRAKTATSEADKAWRGAAWRGSGGDWISGAPKKNSYKFQLHHVPAQLQGSTIILRVPYAVGEESLHTSCLRARLTSKAFSVRLVPAPPSTPHHKATDLFILIPTAQVSIQIPTDKIFQRWICRSLVWLEQRDQ
jgi:hypothetical protein